MTKASAFLGLSGGWCGLLVALYVLAIYASSGWMRGVQQFARQTLGDWFGPVIIHRRGIKRKQKKATMSENYLATVLAA